MNEHRNPALAPEQLVGAYRTMVFKGLMRGSILPCTGQEAVAAGACLAL